MNDDFSDPNPSSEPSWQPPGRKGCVGTLGRWILMSIILALVVLPFTPIAGKIKLALLEIASRARATKIITREVPHEVVRIQRVEVQPPPPPLPSKFVPKKEMDVTTLFNGITINTTLETTEGDRAIKEVEDPNAYKVNFSVSVRVPKANSSIEDLARINPELPKMLPGLGSLVANGKVSGFYHKLYDTKTSLVQRDLSRLNKLLDRHNFFDCETILELTDPKTARKALRLLAKEVGDRGVLLVDEIPAGVIAQGDENYLIQILLNLVQNSLDALAGRPMPTIWLKACETENGVDLIVRDNGMGIPKENLSKIFDPFFTTKQVGQGMGLGLSICFRMIQQMGGEVKIDTVQDSHTQFTLSLKKPENT